MKTLKTLIVKPLLLISTLATVACGSSNITSSVATTDSSEAPSQAGSAVATAFGSSASSSLSAVVVSPEALRLAAMKALEDEADCAGDAGCTCEYAGDSQGPSVVTDASYGDAGTYGSADYSMTMTADDFCTQPDGTANTGTGPDGNGRFAAFELNGDVEGSCPNEDGSTQTIVMQTGSHGIWRNTDVDENGNQYFPQIYGSFDFLVDGVTTSTLDCTIFLNEDESVAFADCSDASGVVVVQDSSSTCSFVTE